VNPAEFRKALLEVPFFDRDAWVDAVLGIKELPDDMPDLPRESVPYLPCGVEEILAMVDEAPVTANSEFVDLGSGLGRVAMLVHLLTGARTHGIELQAHLVQQAHSLSAGLSGVTFTAGDATEIELDGSTFFLYAPFSGDMLQRALARLHEVAQKRTIVIGAVGFEFQDVSWLQPRTTSVPTLTVYVSVSCASVS